MELTAVSKNSDGGGTPRPAMDGAAITKEGDDVRKGCPRPMGMPPGGWWTKLADGMSGFRKEGSAIVGTAACDAKYCS
jgi:hypothetical protein